MDFETSFDDLVKAITEEGDWKLEMGTAYDSESGDVVFVAKITLVDESYGAIGRTPTDALRRAAEGVLRLVSEEEEEDDYDDDELEHAAEVLKATLDELGFDRAVALLERLNNL